MDNQPAFTLKESAVFLHEMYSDLREAGFTKDEALYLVAQSIKPDQQKPEE